MYLMIDNYDSFTYNLYALFKECGADVKIIKNNEYVPAEDYDGIILSPGPSSPENSGTTLDYLKNYTGKKPIFGVCLGMQSIAYSLGFKVERAATIKHGKTDQVFLKRDSVLLAGLPEKFSVVRYHSLAVNVNSSLVTSVSESDGVTMSMEDRDRMLFGVQFHPESILSEHGDKIVKNFLKFVNTRGYMDELVKKVNSGERLAFEESGALFEGMVSGMMTESQIGSVLISMKHRGETEEELAGLVTVMDRYKKRFEADCESIDTCGTGGDGKSTINISTAVSIILSSLGYSVVKHGNVAQSGKVGSADILQEFGLDIHYSKTSPEDFYKKHNYIFMLAPNYHPAMKAVGKVRRELKVPTIFNFVGPLVNPANPKFQVIGVNKQERLHFVAGAIQRMGRKNITVYSSDDGFDEVSSKHETECITIKENGTEKFRINPADFFEPFDMPVVTDREEAMALFLKAMKGEDKNLSRLLALNTALALKTAAGVEMKKGFETAMENISSGKAFAKFREITGR